MEKTLKSIARQAKQRLKTGFWKECKHDIDEKKSLAKLSGVNESKMEQYMSEKVTSQIRGVKEDEFYLRVKAMLDENGEVSDAIGRLTDKEYYETLSYEEKQRYTLALSEKYLKALERYRNEKQFEL